MDYYEFNPPKIPVLIDGMVHYLVPFSLGKMTEIGARYSESGNSVEGIQSLKFIENSDIVLEVLWDLLEDKDLIPSSCQLKKMAENDYETLSNLSKALTIHINNSQPVFTQEDRDNLKQKNIEELQEIDNAKNSSIDWVNIYVIIAREIPYTIEQFYNLTQRQIFAILKRINKVKHEEELKHLAELKLIASFHGVKMKLKTETNGKLKSSFNKSTDDLLTDRLKNRIKSGR